MSTQNRGPIRALVVDDHPDVAEALARLLQAMGCAAAFVTDAGKAVDAASRMEPELVFLDIVMPGIHGYDLARALRTRYGDAILLIAVTAYADASHRDIRRETHFDASVKKPIGADTLENILAAALAHRSRSSRHLSS
jgi:CheY-like chemotaxis protein